jgi:branched-chain amino acid transport system ATP-binding protein
MALLEIVGLCAGYGDVAVLRGVNLSIAAGSITALIGANGAGKTTLLRAISGLVVRRQGSITYAGRQIADRRSDEIVNLGISQVPEGRRLFFPLTVLENLECGALPLHASGRSGEAAAVLSMVFDLFPRLAERKGQIAGTLSGGEQQMLAIARSLMSRPQVLLLDEPSVGLAPKIIETLFEILHKLKGTGLTILLAEQHVPLALDIADRAVIMHLGRVALSGTSAELRGSPEIRRIYLGG